MKATLKIELVGDDVVQRARFSEKRVNEALPGLGTGVFGGWPPSGWVAELIGLDHRYGYKRRFLRPRKDYAKSNSTGSRGVYAWFVIESGKCYEVCEKLSWRHSNRYFCQVTDQGNIVEMDKNEVDEWVKNILV